MTWHVAAGLGLAEDALYAGHVRPRLQPLPGLGRVHGHRTQGPRAVRACSANRAYYTSANRDEQVFADPLAFDIHRTLNDHLTFGGGGPHFCLGAGLARTQIKALIRELLRPHPDFGLAGEVRRLRSDFINGIKYLPVRFN